MRMWAGQSSRPSIRARYTGSPTSCHSPPSHRHRLDHIYAIKVLPPRAEDRAARGSRAPRAPRTACAARPDAHTAARQPRARQTAYTTSESDLANLNGQVIRPQRQSDDPAARHWAGGGAACGGGAQGPSSPSLRRGLRHLYIRTSSGKPGQPVYPRLSPRRRRCRRAGAGTQLLIPHRRLQVPLASMYSSSLELVITLEG
jgi:hypothetical protein